MSYKRIVFLFIFLILLFLTVQVHAYNNEYQNGYIRDSRYLKVYYRTENDIKYFAEKGLIIDRILSMENAFSCYAEPEHIAMFESLSLKYSDIPTYAEMLKDPEYRKSREAYRTFPEVETELSGIASADPDMAELITIGTSVQGRNLYFLRITSNIQSDPVKPEFHYISTMHGDEPVGTEMCMEFIHYLIDNYGTDTYVTDLLDEIDFYIMPVMNPDGFVANTRYNANGYDLNRNFPDFINDPEDDPSGKQTETAELMQFYAERRGVLSANFHTGALVVNYPWDTTYDNHPENDMLIELSLRYSEQNSPMYNSSTFQDGITNGADWYIIDGGMQDYACYYHSNTQVTVELSDEFAPDPSELPQYWLENKYSMLYYAGALRRGVQGYVLDSSTYAPVSAEITVDGINWVFENDPASGMFHKMLLPGTYTVNISADGYLDQIISGVVVGSDWDTTTFLGNIYMEQDTSSYVSLNHYVINDSGYNGDGILNPGESAGLTININNNSASTITGLTATISSESSYLGISQDYSAYPDILSGGSADNTTPYAISVSNDCPHDEIVRIRFDWSYAKLSGAFYVDIQVKSTNFTEIGDGTTEVTNAPLYTYYEDNRTQVIYTADDMGNVPLSINSLSINVTTAPSLTLTNWTIRMKHTTKADYESSAVFENTGWTVVYQANTTISATGWNEFVFAAPFEYDGSQNLMVDFSFNNDEWASPGGKVYWTGTSTAQSIYGYTDSGYGDPLDWSSSTHPTVYASDNFINLKLGLVADNPPMNLDRAIVSLNPDLPAIYQWEYSESKPFVFEEKGSTWTIVMNGNYADKVVTGDITGDGIAEAIAYFAGQGLYLYDFESFSQITTGVINDFCLADIDGTGVKTLIASLDGFGIYKWIYSKDRSTWQFDQAKSTWERINTQLADIILAVDIFKNGVDELFVAFNGLDGGYIYQFAEDLFTKAVTVSPVNLAKADIDGDGYAELVSAFEGLGIYLMSYTAKAGQAKSIPCIDLENDIKESFVWTSKGGNKAFQWMRILIVAPDADTEIATGNITSDSIDEIFTVIAGRTYYYQPSGQTWNSLVAASFDRMILGKFSQDQVDDIILSSKAGEFIYLYKSDTASFERIMMGAYASDMAVILFDEQ